jgi:O-acetyl-ADP-ribose deacetylase (regulator of RNase III)
VIEEQKIKSTAIPPLGAGLGGLSWGQVRPRLERALKPLETVEVVVYEPNPDAAPSPVPQRQKHLE